MPENIQMICLVRLIVAAVCGLLIGVERQTRMKGAGSRTHMMVSLGAALMTLVSSYGFLPIVGAAGVSVDVSRVAASIAAGIGFLGAGVIFVHRGGVVGLTTAAGLWTTTGVGMAIGCGMYAPGITATALMLIAQVLLRGVERREKMQVTELVVGLTGQRRSCASVRLAGAEENHRARDRSQAAGRQFGKNRAVHCHAAAFR